VRVQNGSRAKAGNIITLIEIKNQAINSVYRRISLSNAADVVASSFPTKETASVPPVFLGFNIYVFKRLTGCHTW